MRIIIFLSPNVTRVFWKAIYFLWKNNKSISTIKLYVLSCSLDTVLWMAIPVFYHVKGCQKWLIIIIPICPSLWGEPWSCTIIFQVPGEEAKSLYLPLANSSSLTYETCEEYLDPRNHSLGKTVCSQGYEFQFEGENEWTVTAEVKQALCCVAHTGQTPGWTWCWNNTLFSLFCSTLDCTDIVVSWYLHWYNLEIPRDIFKLTTIKESLF